MLVSGIKGLCGSPAGPHRPQFARPLRTPALGTRRLSARAGSRDAPALGTGPAPGTRRLSALALMPSTGITDSRFRQPPGKQASAHERHDLADESLEGLDVVRSGLLRDDRPGAEVDV